MMMNEQSELPEIVTQAEMLRLAEKMAKFERRMQKLRRFRSDVAKKLLEAMNAQGFKRIPVPNLGAVVEVRHDRHRQVKKSDIMTRWPLEGADFWATLPKHDKKYLCVLQDRVEPGK